MWSKLWLRMEVVDAYKTKRSEAKRVGRFCQAAPKLACRIGPLFLAAVQLVAALYVTTL